jgi:hypothetical protein
MTGEKRVVRVAGLHVLLQAKPERAAVFPRSIGQARASALRSPGRERKADKFKHAAAPSRGLRRIADGLIDNSVKGSDYAPIELAAQGVPSGEKQLMSG